MELHSHTQNIPGSDLHRSLVLLRTPSCEANVTAALYYVFLFFLFELLKVSFGRTLEAELSLETLSQTANFPLRAVSGQLCFRLAFRNICWELDSVETCSGGAVLSRWFNKTLKKVSHFCRHIERTERIQTQMTLHAGSPLTLQLPLLVISSTFTSSYFQECRSSLPGAGGLLRVDMLRLKVVTCDELRDSNLQVSHHRFAFLTLRPPIPNQCSSTAKDSLGGRKGILIFRAETFICLLKMGETELNLFGSQKCSL